LVSNSESENDDGIYARSVAEEFYTRQLSAAAITIILLAIATQNDQPDANRNVVRFKSQLTSHPQAIENRQTSSIPN